MTLTAKIVGTDYASTRIRLRATGDQGIAGLASAADGSMSSGGIVLDDPLGELTVDGWEQVAVNETACVAAPRLYTGLVGGITERRGKYKTGNGREIDLDINDQNMYLSLRLIDGADGKRKEETSAARLAWLLGSTYLSGLVYDLGLIKPANLGTLVYDANDYRGSYATDVLASLCGPRQEIYFCYWDQEEEKVGLFFDIPTSTAFTSALTISNVRADNDPIDDPDATCFYPNIDGERVVDPSTVYSSVRLVYATGVINRFDGATGVTWFPAPLLRRGQNIEIPGIGKLETANIWAQRILAGSAHAAVQVTCTVRLPRSKVGLIEAGHRIFVRFQHLTGFETGAWTRVERRNIVQTEGTRAYYDVNLTLSTGGLLGSGGSPGGTTPLPHPPPSAGALVQEKGSPSGTVVMDNPTTDGNLLIAWTTMRTFATLPAAPVGFTSVDTVETSAGPYHSGRLSYKIADGDGDTFISVGGGAMIHVSEWSGVSLGAYVKQDDQSGTTVSAGGAITPASANSFVVGNGVYGGFLAVGVSPAAGVTELYESVTPGGLSPTIWVGYKTVATPVSTSIDGTLNISEAWAGITYELLPEAGSNPPEQSQPVNGEVVTMTGPSGTTAFPFADGSLKVFVDNTDQTAALIYTDGECGDFTLAFTPTPTEQVVVWYQGR